jgi:hypothetical protein
VLYWLRLPNCMAHGPCTDRREFSDVNTRSGRSTSSISSGMGRKPGLGSAEYPVMGDRIHHHYFAGVLLYLGCQTPARCMTLVPCHSRSYDKSLISGQSKIFNLCGTGKDYRLPAATLVHVQGGCESPAMPHGPATQKKCPPFPP